MKHSLFLLYSLFLSIRSGEEQEQSNNITIINNFAIPIEWNEISISSPHTSMSILSDSYDNIYLCGGKISLYGKSSECVRISITKESSLNSFEIEQTYSGGNGLKASGPFPGLYLNAKSFISETQNEGGIYEDRMCMLSISDGTNKPKCWCCDITDLNRNNGNGNQNDIKCDDLQYKIGCPSRFDACVINDYQNNMIYQIGGYYGQTMYDTVLCFDLITETYKYGQQCPYSPLIKPIYGLGCAMLPNGRMGQNTIVTVGGLTTLSTSSSTVYSQSIDICKTSTNCEQLSISLDEGVFKTRVFAIDDCHIGIAGGSMKSDGSDLISDRIDIANVCNSSWVRKNEQLPIPLSEMGVIQTNGIFCLYGGVTLDDYSNIHLSQAAYCTDLGYTQSPTTTSRPSNNPTPAPTSNPTPAPTDYPTSPPTGSPITSPTPKPTSIPTIAGTGDIIMSDPTFTKEFVQFNQGMSGQTCFSDQEYLYVCGGYSDGSTSYNQCYIYNDNGDKRVIPMYLTESMDQILLPMPNFYCQNDCSAMYKNQIFLVNPSIDGATDVSLYRCTIDLYTNDGFIECIDLCKHGNLVHQNLAFCDNVLNFESCVTSEGQYLYISGGKNSNGELSNNIVVFDMDPANLDWASVPSDSILSMFGYKTYFGSLDTAIASHSCSYWNSSLYIIGGKDSSFFPQSTIQICPNPNKVMNKFTNPQSVRPCKTSSNTLNDARYNARSKVIGSSIVTVCGAKSMDEFSEQIEVYDAFFDEYKSSSILEDGARTACCLMDWASKEKLVISGGEKWTGLKSETIDNMIYSEYIKEPVIVTPPETNELLDCAHINVDTRDFSFKSQYDIYNQIDNYYIFATNDRKAYLIIDATGMQKTWIYNYTEKTSCFYNRDHGQVIDVGPGLWTKPRTRTSQTHSILITLSCLDALTVNEDDNYITILNYGMTEAAFITCLVVATLIVITMIMVIFCCWWKRKSLDNKNQYDLQSSPSDANSKKKSRKNSRKNKKRNQHKAQRLETPQNDDDDSSDNQLIDEDSDNDQDINNGQHHHFEINKKSSKGTFGLFNLSYKTKNSPQYMAAKSYSHINNVNTTTDLSKTITIVRHSTLNSSDNNVNNSTQHQKHNGRVSFSDDIIYDDNNESNDNDNGTNKGSVELQQLQHHHCKISRIRDDSIGEEEEEDDDDDNDNNNGVDEDENEDTMIENEMSSCSTVNPHEVEFAANDKNTVMIDQIAMELNREQQNALRIHRKTQSTEIDPKYKRQEPEKPAQSINTIYMKPSALNLAGSQSQNTPTIQSIEPVIVSCPPPPPPPHVTMNTLDDDEDENHDDDDQDNEKSHNINDILISHRNGSNGSFSEDNSTAIFGLNNHSHNLIYDELTDVSHPNINSGIFHPSRMSVSKDNYAGHVNDHISQHENEDRTYDVNDENK